jgi:hypothetical protein
MACTNHLKWLTVERVYFKAENLVKSVVKVIPEPITN